MSDHREAMLQTILAEARAEGAAEVRARVEAIHRPSSSGYCDGCWEAGGYDGAPEWPCPTIRALTAGGSA